MSKTTTVAIIGAANYVSTRLMSSLSAMGCHVSGYDFYHKDSAGYSKQWLAAKSPLYEIPLNQRYSVDADILIFGALAENIIQVITPNLHHQGRINNLINHLQLKRNPSKTILIAPYNHHTSNLSPHELEKLYGKHDHDTIIFQLQTLATHYQEQFTAKAHKTPIITVQIADIYGPQMPTPHNHSLFHATVHRSISKSKLRNDFSQHYQPTHINDLINGLLKIIFTKELSDSVYPLVNTENKPLHQWLPQLTHMAAKNWHHQPDYPIYAQTKNIYDRLGWFPRNSFHQYVQKHQKTITSKHIHRTKVNSAITHHDPTSYTSTSKTNPHHVHLSMFIVLSIFIFPFAHTLWSLNQLKQGMQDFNLHVVSTSTSQLQQNINSLKWFYTLIQKRSETEQVLAATYQIMVDQAHPISIEHHLDQGYQLAYQLLTAQYTSQLSSQISVWHQQSALIMQHQPQPPRFGVLSSILDDASYRYYQQLDSYQNTTQAQQQLLAGFIKRLTSAAITSKSGAALPTSAQLLLNPALSQNPKTWFSAQAQSLTLHTNRYQTLAALDQHFKHGNIRPREDRHLCDPIDTHCLNITYISGNQSYTASLPKVSATYQNNLLSLKIQDISPEVTAVQIHGEGSRSLYDITDRYPRELTMVNLINSKLGTYVHYNRPEDTSGTINIVIRLSTDKSKIELITPFNSDLSPSRLYISGQ